MTFSAAPNAGWESQDNSHVEVFWRKLQALNGSFTSQHAVNFNSYWRRCFLYTHWNQIKSSFMELNTAV